MEEELQIPASTTGANDVAGQKFALYGGMAGGIVVIDQITKLIAQRMLPPYQPVPVLGDFFRLTYIYNPGAAFGLHVGPLSRYVFLALTVACVAVLFVWFRSTP